MPRKSQIDAAGALHHIIARGIDRSKIFQDPTDKRNFLKRLAELFKIPSSELWLSGKHRQRVRAKSLLCYWANRELGISMAKLSRRMNVSVMAVSYAVRRGEKIAREFNFSFEL